MTLIQERKLGIVKMYLHDKNGALKSWGTHTDRHDQTHY